MVSTLVAEVYGPDYQRQIEVAQEIRKIFEDTPGVVDVDWYSRWQDQKKLDFHVQQDKAAMRNFTRGEFLVGGNGRWRIPS